MPFGRPIDLGNPVSDHPLNYGLVSWWLPLPHNSGSSTLFDLVATGRNHGTLTNGPTWTAGRDGFGALTYNGSNQSVAIDSVPNALGDQTWAACLMPGSGANQDRAWLSTGTGSSVYGVYLSVTANGNAHFFWNPAGTYISGGTVPTGVYSHVACVRSGSTRTVYVNGVSAASASDAGTGLSAYSSTTIGRRVDGLTGTPFFDGTISSVWHYSRELSAPEVAGLYDQSLRGYPDLLRRVPTARSFVAPAAGGGGGFQPAWAMQSTVVVGGAF